MVPDAAAPDPSMRRRGFLKWMSGIGAALAAIIVGAPAGAASGLGCRVPLGTTR